MKPGLYTGLTWAEYSQIEGASYSLLKLFDRSAAHAQEYILHPKAPTAAMELGQAVDCSILEPEAFKSTYAVPIKVDRRFKAGKVAWAEFEAANEGKEILKHDDYAACIGMSESVWRHPLAKSLLSGPGQNKVALVWHDAETGMLCKGQPDRVTELGGWTIILDLKKTQDARPRLFGSQCASLKYHVQAAFYKDGMDAIAPRERRFLHLAVEEDRPHAVAVYELDYDALKQGREEYRSYLRTLKACRESNVWPGYPDGIEPLFLPKWALNLVEV